jgi:hypothetical protein
MTKPLPLPAAAYVQAVNHHDADGFMTLFTDRSTVDDNGRQFRGRKEIQAWSDREVFGASVTLEVLEVADRNGAIVVTTEVDGNFDRTGLPDPVVIDHHIVAEGRKIIVLTCRLSERTQQLRLELERQVADLVQEQGAAIGALEAADAPRHRPGERPALVAEELTLEQARRGSPRS